jgi:hypothetical protein
MMSKYRKTHTRVLSFQFQLSVPYSASSFNMRFTVLMASLATAQSQSHLHNAIRKRVSPLVSAGREDGSQSLVSKFEEETLTTVDVNADFLGTGSPVHPRKLADNPWTQFGEDIDGEAAGDFSGVSVSISSDGKRVAIGATGNDGNGSRSGHVQVFDLTGSEPKQIGGDINGDAANDGSGTSVALSSDGNRLVIGAALNDGNGRNSGHARVFEFKGEAWIQLGNDIDGEAGGDSSGGSVAISADGNRVAIGANGNDGNNRSSGHVRVFGLDVNAAVNDAMWSQIGEDIDGEVGGDFSGGSVALSSDGNRVAIGADFNSGSARNSGQVRVFGLDVKVALNVATWSKIGQDIDGEAAFDLSGVSVAISADGNRIAIGAVFNDGSNGESPDTGHARVFYLDGEMWIQIGEDIDGEAAGDRAGLSVAISADGNRVAIGAELNDGNGDSSGLVRVFDLDVKVAVNDATWSQIGQDIDGEATGDRSGGSVALSADGNRVVIGATGNDGNGGSSGHTRIFDYVVCSALYLYVHGTPV